MDEQSTDEIVAVAEEAEEAVTEPRLTAVQKVASNPWATLIAAVIIGGGAGGGLGFLNGGNGHHDVEDRLRVVETQCSQAASQTDVAVLATKMDLMTTAFEGMQDEFRELRNRRPAP